MRVATRTKRTSSELAAYVVEQLRLAGIDKRECSRFAQVRRLYDSSGPSIASDSSTFDEALEGQRDLQTLGFVFDNLGEWSKSPEFGTLLSICVKDALLPQGGKSDSKGRDAQFHLMLAATCQRAGLRPRLAEPDIVCKLDYADFGIAAKRIKSLEKLDDRIDEAARQFKRTRLPGIIAADLSMALNRENRRPLAAGRANEFMTFTLQDMQLKLRPRITDFKRSLDTTRVRGIVFFNSYVAVGKDHEPEYLSCNLGVCTVFKCPDRIIHFHKFHREFARGLDRPQNRLPKLPRRRDLVHKYKNYR